MWKRDENRGNECASDGRSRGRRTFPLPSSCANPGMLRPDVRSSPPPAPIPRVCISPPPGAVVDALASPIRGRARRRGPRRGSQPSAPCIGSPPSSRGRSGSSPQEIKSYPSTDDYPGLGAGGAASAATHPGVAVGSMGSIGCVPGHERPARAPRRRVRGARVHASKSRFWGVTLCVASRGAGTAARRCRTSCASRRTRSRASSTSPSRCGARGSCSRVLREPLVLLPRTRTLVTLVRRVPLRS